VNLPDHDSNNKSKRDFRIAIVGSGCTALKIATLITKYAKSAEAQGLNLKITLLESTHRVGGLLQTQRHLSGLKVEHAAQGVLASRTIFLETLEELGLTPEDLIAPPKERQLQTRFLINRSKNLVALRPSLLQLWKHGLLSPIAFLRILKDLLIGNELAPDPNETLYKFFERHFGHAVAENFILPFATGIWGGGAEQLLLRHAFPRLAELEIRYGSLLRGMLASALRGKQQKNQLTGDALKHAWPQGLLSFPNGMHTLIEQFSRVLQIDSRTASSAIQLKLTTPVQSIRKTEQGTLLLNDSLEFDTVFWTATPWSSPQLKWNQKDSQREWDSLQSTPTHGLIVVNLAGPRSPATRDGFGALAPRSSDGLLGVLFVHSIYPQHVPHNSYSYRALLAGDRNPEMILWDDAKLREYSLQELRTLKLIGENESPTHVDIVRWPRAIGIADRDHDARMRALWRIQAEHPNVHFAGIYKKGVGVADALQSGKDSFEEWLSGLRPSH